VRDLVALVNEVQAGRHGGVALELERAHLGHALDQVLHALVDRALVQDHAQALEDPRRRGRASTCNHRQMRAPAAQPQAAAVRARMRGGATSWG